MCKYEITEFIYDESRSFETNFDQWFQLNTQERYNFNEDPLHPEEAHDMFVSRYGEQYGHNNVT
tara:strand:+ start:267 stop:458 length:192 start_codon:yes stop_codon:yes gene_type:complete